MRKICGGVTCTTQAQIAGMNRAELMTRISDILSNLEAKGVSGVTTTSYVKVLKSWVSFNGKRLDEKANVPDSEAGYADEVVPRPDDVQAPFDYSSLGSK